MPPSHAERRQRISKDKASLRVVLLAMFAWLVALLSLVYAVLPDQPGTQRGELLYWMLMLPFAAWGVALVTLNATAVRLLPVALIALPLLSLLAVWLEDWAVGASAAFAFCTCLSIAATATRRNSALRQP